MSVPFSVPCVVYPGLVFCGPGTPAWALRYLVFRLGCKPSAASSHRAASVFQAKLNTKYQILTTASLRHFLHLSKLQLHRGRPAEVRNHHLQRLAIFVYIVHRAVEVGEGPVGNADGLVLLEFHPDL